MRFRGTPLRAVVALVLFFCGYATVGVAASATAIKGGHYEPTLLQIVDPKTNELLRVTDHRSFYKAVPYELPDIIIPSSFYLRNNNPFDMTTTRNSFIAMTSDGNDDDMDDDSKKNTRIINSGGDTPHHQHQHVLQVDKTELHQVRESLTVSWQGVDNKDEDVLALYCDNEDSHGQLLLMEAATIDQVRATSIKHRVGGDRKENIAQDDDERNSWYIPNFPITRSSACTFVLYRGGGDHQQTTETKKNRQYSYVPIASSPTIGLFLNDIATNVHLALGDDISSMIVHFTTGSNKTCNCHRDDGTPVAMYRQVGGTNTSNANNSPLPKMVIGTTTSYQAKDMCDNPANITGPGHFYPPGQLHTIMLTDLQPNTKYKYKVRLDIAGGTSTDWSEEYTFTSPPLVGDKSDYVYVVYGDQGCPSTGWGDGGEWTSRMERQEPSLQAVHHFGDLSYARGAAHMWDEWLAITQQFATKVPLMIGVGNHEYDHVRGGENGKDPSGVPKRDGFRPRWGNMGGDSGGECAVPTSKRFRMPKTGNGVFWYSYDSASVHTIMLSGEHELFPGSVQHTWLLADLQSVDRAITPWVVIEIHRPLYTNENWEDQHRTALGLRYEFEDLLQEYEVDLVLAGHLHSYFRSCPGLFHDQCNNGGPTHITVGTAGAQPDVPNGFYNNHWTANWFTGVFGYGRISILKNATALHFEFVKAGAENDTMNGMVLDDVWLRK